MPKQWFPLESNPQIMTAYVKNLGVDMSTLGFHDVLSTEDWALEMVPQPVLGVLMLFPIKDDTEQFRLEEKERIEREGQTISPNCYYMKQTVGNACGTVGILHCLLNCKDQLVLQPNAYIEKFLTATLAMTPDERAEYLNNDDEIEVAHETAASEGQSEQVNAEVDTHFICFT